MEICAFKAQKVFSGFTLAIHYVDKR